jgi:hypothetical protein
MTSKNRYFKLESSPLAESLSAMRTRMRRTGQWNRSQMAGRRWPVACVSLEITQRCNLDCTLCYLSKSAESIQDLPLEEIFRRIDIIARDYGPNTNVQVSGGEPTLRRPEELLAIVQRVVQRGLRPALLTNGIRATRNLLCALTRAGLTEVVFHVDTTQQRNGYATEEALNTLRMEYIERAQDLPIGIFFNTTVHLGNLDEIPMLAAFFTAHANRVGLASFLLQAATGRSRLDAGVGGVLSSDTVITRLRSGVGVPLNFDALSAGHCECTRFAVMLVCNGQGYDAFTNAAFIQRFMRQTASFRIARGTPWRSIRSLGVALVQRPVLWLASLRWGLVVAWRARADLVTARGQAHKLTFVLHNFMDECRFDPERIEACAFMAITPEGPLSMCSFNARRNHYLLRPVPMAADTHPRGVLPHEKASPEG